MDAFLKYKKNEIEKLLKSGVDMEEFLGEDEAYGEEMDYGIEIVK